MKREVYTNGANTNISERAKQNIIVSNIIDDYKENNDNSNLGELTTAYDGELIYSARAVKNYEKGQEQWFLEFPNGHQDGPYTKIEYNQDSIYCTILFSLAYRYELSGLLKGVGYEFGYYAYIKKFIEEHKEAYDKYKKANEQLIRAYSITKAQRMALAELDYRQQRLRADNQNATHTTYNELSF